MAQAWYIYTLHDPRKPELVRYVGWTRNTHTRLQGHIRLAKNGRDKTYCGKWKRTLLRAGLRPLLTVIETGSGDDWAEAEIRWIAHYRALVGAKLTNLANGGGGPAGHHWKLSEETKARMSIASRRRGFTEEAREKARTSKLGVPLTLEHRAKLSAVRVGKKRAPESVAKTAEWWRGRNHTEVTKAKFRAMHAELGATQKLPEQSLEMRSKISSSLKTYYAERGTRKLSDETKGKISVALKAYRAGAKHQKI